MFRYVPDTIKLDSRECHVTDMLTARSTPPSHQRRGPRNTWTCEVLVARACRLCLESCEDSPPYKSLLSILKMFFRLREETGYGQTRLICKDLFDKDPKLLQSKSQPGRITSQMRPSPQDVRLPNRTEWPQGNRALQRVTHPNTLSRSPCRTRTEQGYPQSDPWPDPGHLAGTCAKHKPCLFPFSTKSPSFSQPLKTDLLSTKP